MRWSFNVIPVITILYTDYVCLPVTWNQFDGVAYVKDDKHVLYRVWDYFSQDTVYKTVEYRTKALSCFFPKWKGFLVNETAEEMVATEALMELQHVVTCLTDVWIEESGYRRMKHPPNFDVREVIC